MRIQTGHQSETHRRCDPSSPRTHIGTSERRIGILRTQISQFCVPQRWRAEVPVAAPIGGSVRVTDALFCREVRVDC
jgi:hypothetical protein